MRKLSLILAFLLICWTAHAAPDEALKDPRGNKSLLGADGTETRLIGTDSNNSLQVGVYDSSGNAVDTFGIAETVDAVATGDVTPIGGIAETTVPTAVADGDVVDINVNEYGEIRDASYNYATGATDVNPIAQEPIGSGSITCIDTTLDADPTTATCTVFIGDKKKVSVLLNAVMDWTDSDPDLDLDLDMSVSADNSTFYAFESIIDKTGEDSPVTGTVSLALSGADTDTTHTEQYSIPTWFTAQYLKITLTATNSDADDTVVADVLVQYQK